LIDHVEIVKFFAALVAITNPVQAIPLLISMTPEASQAERAKIALVAAAATLITLLVAALAGGPILNFFGISIASFRTAGGLIILLMALAMLHARPSAIHSSKEEHEHGRQKDNPAVFPLAIPIFAGPGALATVIVTSHQAGGLVGYAAVGGVIVFIVTLLYLAMRMAGKLAGYLGTTGMNVMTRLMGILLSAIAIDMLAQGLGGLFPTLAKAAGG